MFIISFTVCKNICPGSAGQVFADEQIKNVRCLSFSVYVVSQGRQAGANKLTAFLSSLTGHAVACH